MTTIYTNKQLRPRDPHDFYPTPLGLALDSLKQIDGLLATKSPRVLDPGAGKGVWGQAARELFPNAHITGVELQDRPHNPAYDRWFTADYLSNYPDPTLQYDLIVGNPPYKFAEQFIEKSLTQITDSGLIVFLLRLCFLEGQKRLNSLWKPHNPVAVFVSSRRPSFTGNGKTDGTGYAVFMWKGNRGSFNTNLYWLDWQYRDCDLVQ